MHVLIFGVGTSGDVFPLFGVAAALRRRGHEVTFAANDVFEPHARKCGLEFLSIGTRADFQRVFEDPRIWDWQKGWPLLCSEVLIPSIEPVYEIARERYVPGKTVLLGSVMAYGARVAQETLGAPLATMQVSPSSLRTVHRPALAHPYFIQNVPPFLIRYQYWLADKFAIDRVVQGPLNRFRAQFGLKPASRLLGHWIHSPDRVIGLFPEWFAPPQPDWPTQTRLTGFVMYDGGAVAPATPELERFLAAGERPIAFTAGSAMLDSQAFFRESAEACRLLGCRGLLMTPFPEQAPPRLPPGVMQAFAPFSWLLPQVSAIVHHGGVGTIARAMAAGVPQLAMPMAYDQPDNAQRLERLGVGGTISRRSFRAATVAKRLRELLESPQVAQACRHAAAQFAGADPAEETCRLIEELAISRTLTVHRSESDSARNVETQRSAR